MTHPSGVSSRASACQTAVGSLDQNTHIPHWTEQSDGFRLKSVIQNLHYVSAGYQLSYRFIRFVPLEQL